MQLPLFAFTLPLLLRVVLAQYTTGYDCEPSTFVCRGSLSEFHSPFPRPISQYAPLLTPLPEKDNATQKAMESALARDRVENPLDYGKPRPPWRKPEEEEQLYDVIFRCGPFGDSLDVRIKCWNEWCAFACSEYSLREMEMGKNLCFSRVGILTMVGTEFINIGAPVIDPPRRRDRKAKQLAAKGLNRTEILVLPRVNMSFVGQEGS